MTQAKEPFKIQKCTYEVSYTSDKCAKPRKDYEVGFVLVAVRVFVPPTRPGKNCPVESGDAYRNATVVSYPDLSYPALLYPIPTYPSTLERIKGKEGRKNGKRGGRKGGDISRSTLTGRRLDDMLEYNIMYSVRNDEHT